jgi:hypothetical protein
MPRQARLDARPHRLSARDGGQAPGLLQHVMARPPRLKAKPTRLLTFARSNGGQVAGRQGELKEERSSKTIKTVSLSYNAWL